MWIKKSQAEINIEKRGKLLRVICLDVLLGLGLWYGLVRLSMFFGLLSRGSVSGYIACGVIAVILPAAWHAHRQSRRKSRGTMVCDRCNVVKATDDQPACRCGGNYFTLAEMKWISSETFPAEAERRNMARGLS